MGRASDGEGSDGRAGIDEQGIRWATAADGQGRPAVGVGGPTTQRRPGTSVCQP